MRSLHIADSSCKGQAQALQSWSMAASGLLDRHQQRRQQPLASQHGMSCREGGRSPTREAAEVAERLLDCRASPTARVTAAPVRSMPGPTSMTRSSSSCSQPGKGVVNLPT